MDNLQDLSKNYLEQQRDDDIYHETDNWKILLTKEELDKMNIHLAKIISDKFRGKDIIVTVILKGAAYFYTDLTRYMTIPHSSYFIEASSYKDTQTQHEEVEILSRIVPDKFKNKIVVLIDELFDNGATLDRIKRKILQEVPALNEESFFTCTMFKKNKKTSYPEPNLYGFTIPNVWVVGYGLDDKQTKRNWIHLYAKPKSIDVPKSDDDVIFENNDVYHTMRNDLIKCLCK
jgi:hypoxanthine phosphoribosyltransferase